MGSIDLAEFVKEVVDACSEAVRLDPDGGLAPNSLYHFTDVKGFIGILTSKCLWASLVTELDDAAEVVHGIEVAKSVLLDRFKAASASDYEQVLLAQLEKPTSPLFGVSFNTSAFVVSFCAKCDKSGQWLHYGRNGAGVAIGFSPALAQTVSYDLHRIDYSIDSQRVKMERLVNAARSVLHRHRDPSMTWMVEVAAHLASMFIRLLAASMKHASFANDEEWRLIATDFRRNQSPLENSVTKREMRSRIVGERLIPYEELSFAGKEGKLISEIVVGFSAPTGLDAIRILASEHGVRSAVFCRSEVPVRGQTV